MGRNDREFNRVDKYRRNLGKQEAKQNRKQRKAARSGYQSKQDSQGQLREAFYVLAGLVVVLAGILFFVARSKGGETAPTPTASYNDGMQTV